MYHAGVRCSCNSGCKPQELLNDGEGDIYREVVCLCGKKEGCLKCGGSGFYLLDNCINFYLDSNVLLFYECYFKYKDNVMPILGGYLDQANSFIVNVRRFGTVLNKYEGIKAQRKANG